MRWIPVENTADVGICINEARPTYIKNHFVISRKFPEILFHSTLDNIVFQLFFAVTVHILMKEVGIFRFPVLSNGSMILREFGPKQASQFKSS